MVNFPVIEGFGFSQVSQVVGHMHIKDYSFFHGNDLELFPILIKKN